MSTMREFMQKRKESPPQKYRCGCVFALIPTLDRECPACAKKHKKPKLEPQLFRYPHGTQIVTAYDAENEMWEGALTVPAIDGSVALFLEARHTAVHRLLKKLADRYRRAIAKNKDT